MKVVVTGSLAFDFIMDFPGKFADHILPEKIHAINLSFLVKDMSRQQGGTAGNIAYNLALLGIKPTILATAGNDFADYKNELEKIGVDTSMIYIIEAEPTASAFIFTDMADNQITGFYPGAMRKVGRLSLRHVITSAAKQSLADTRANNGLTSLTTGSRDCHDPAKRGLAMTKEPFVVISSNEPRAMIKYVKECQKLGVGYLFDPGMQLPRLSDKDLRLGIEGAKIVIGNDYEMATIEKKLRYYDTKILREGKPKEWRNKNQIWITTLGEKGSTIKAAGKTYKIPPAEPKEVLDPTGAGDAYRAGFLAGFLRGFPLDICGRMGSVAAVYTVEKYGTQTHKFTINEFCQRYQENFKEKLKLLDVKEIYF